MYKDKRQDDEVTSVQLCIIVGIKQINKQDEHIVQYLYKEVEH